MNILNVKGISISKNLEFKRIGYDENCNLIYEINNGNGKAIVFDDDGELQFEGEYLNWKANQKGKEYNESRLKYEGEYLNGERNENGKEYDKNGKIIFYGEYLDGKRCMEWVKNMAIMMTMK